MAAPALLKHLKACNFALTDFVWPPLQVFFTDILPREDWLPMMDYFVAYNEKPDLLIAFVAAYFKYF